MNRKLPSFQEGEEHVKISHFTKQGLDITGIVHVGANDWYEYEFYKKMGIKSLLGFEPLTEAVHRFYARYPQEAYVSPLIRMALGLRTGYMTLNVASGDGQSSTAYELHPTYKKEFPDITFVDTKTVRVYRFDEWYEANQASLKINPLDEFNCLVVDVEGMELAVLRGMGKYLRKFAMLNIELSGEETYMGAPLAHDVILFLASQGFVQDSPVEAHNDVFFLREDIATLLKPHGDSYYGQAGGIYK